MIGNDLYDLPLDSEKWAENEVLSGLQRIEASGIETKLRRRERLYTVWVRFSMRGWVAGLVMAVGMVGGGRAQLKVASPTELGVVKVLVQQEAAWNRGDIDAFATGYKNSPDVLFIGSHVSRGHDDLVNDYRKNYPNREAMGTLGFSELEVHPLDENFAVVVGKYHLERAKKAGGNADGIFSLVFEKTDVGWKIVVDHTS